MLPWMIEKIKEEDKVAEGKQLPLHLPLPVSHLTSSIEQVKKKEKRGSVEIDYSL